MGLCTQIIGCIIPMMVFIGFSWRLIYRIERPCSTWKMSEHACHIKLNLPEMSCQAEHCLRKKHKPLFESTHIFFKTEGCWSRIILESVWGGQCRCELETALNGSYNSYQPQLTTAISRSSETPAGNGSAECRWDQEVMKVLWLAELTVNYLSPVGSVA